VDRRGNGRLLHRAVRLFSGASPALHLQDVPQAVRHAWYATGGPHKRKQAKHNKQRKPASNRGTHHPLPPLGEALGTSPRRPNEVSSAI
jgi:hypothetical protein